MGSVIRGPWRHARTSSKDGREISLGHSSSERFSANHPSARSSRLTLISAPPSSAASFLPSSKTRELTVDKGTSFSAAYRRATMSSCSMPDIGAISVNLPVLSTVNLPDALPKHSGQSTGMDLAILLTNIEHRLEALGISSDEASRRAKRPDAIRNLRRKVATGAKGSMRADTLEALARVLEATVPELTSPPRPPTPPIPGLREYLLQQRALIDQQLANLDAEEMAAKKPPKRKSR